MSCEHPKSGVRSSKQQCMHGELARADGKGPWYCMNPDCGFTLWPSAAKEPEIERLTQNILEIDIQRAKRIANLHRASDETTVCNWLRTNRRDGQPSAFVEANCGVSFRVQIGTVSEYRFCPSCGKRTVLQGSSEEPSA